MIYAPLATAIGRHDLWSVCSIRRMRSPAVVVGFGPKGVEIKTEIVRRETVCNTQYHCGRRIPNCDGLTAVVLNLWSAVAPRGSAAASTHDVSDVGHSDMSALLQYCWIILFLFLFFVYNNDM